MLKTIDEIGHQLGVDGHFFSRKIWLCHTTVQDGVCVAGDWSAGDDRRLAYRSHEGRAGEPAGQIWPSPASSPRIKATATTVHPDATTDARKPGIP